MAAGYVMAFDFGLRHIGVALGQGITQTARGIGTITAKNGKPNWRELTPLLEEFQPQQLIVGLPLNMDSTESAMATQARRFADQLASRTQLPVTMHDERLSTREARGAFAEAKALGSANTEHELAACLILESWFESSS